MLKMGDKMPKTFGAVATPTVTESFWHFVAQIQQIDRPQ